MNDNDRDVYPSELKDVLMHVGRMMKGTVLALLPDPSSDLRKELEMFSDSELTSLSHALGGAKMDVDYIRRERQEVRAGRTRRERQEAKAGRTRRTVTDGAA